MTWYHYIVCFFAGPFITNVHGISGNPSPTPFTVRNRWSFTENKITAKLAK